MGEGYMERIVRRDGLEQTDGLYAVAVRCGNHVRAVENDQTLIVRHIHIVAVYGDAAHVTREGASVRFG